MKSLSKILVAGLLSGIIGVSTVYAQTPGKPEPKKVETTKVELKEKKAEVKEKKAEVKTEAKEKKHHHKKEKKAE